MGISKEGKVPLSRNQKKIAKLINESGKKLTTIGLKKLASNPFGVAGESGVDILDELNNAFSSWRTLPGNSSSFLKGAAEDTQSVSTTSSHMSKAEKQEHERNRTASLEGLAQETELQPTSPGGHFARQIMDNLKTWFPTKMLNLWMKENKTSLEEIDNLSVRDDKDRIDELKESYESLSAALKKGWDTKHRVEQRKEYELENEKLRLERETGVVLPPQSKEETEKGLRELSISHKKQQQLENKEYSTSEEEEEEEEEDENPKTPTPPESEEEEETPEQLRVQKEKFRKIKERLEEEAEYDFKQKQKYGEKYELYKQLMIKQGHEPMGFEEYVDDVELEEADVRPEHEKAGYGPDDDDDEKWDQPTPQDQYPEAYDQYLASKPTNPITFDDFATQLAEQDQKQRQHPFGINFEEDFPEPNPQDLFETLANMSDESSDEEPLGEVLKKPSGSGLKEGSFSHQLQNHNKKHSSKMGLEHFAHMVITSPKHFDKRALKQAQFYLDIIMHQKSKGKGIVKEDEELKSHDSNIMPMIHSVRHSVQHPAMASPHPDFVLTPNARANMAAFHGGALKDDMMHMYHRAVPKSMRSSVEHLARETGKHVLRHPEVKKARKHIREKYESIVPRELRPAIANVAYTGMHHAMEGNGMECGTLKTRMQRTFNKVVPNKKIRKSLVDLGKAATHEIVNSAPVKKIRRQVKEKYDKVVPDSLKSPLEDLGKATFAYGKRKAGYGLGCGIKKGSQEMKDKMARLRAMRGKSRGGAIPAPPSRSPITDPSLI
jgi:hypothetical protein